MPDQIDDFLNQIAEEYEQELEEERNGKRRPVIADDDEKPARRSGWGNGSSNPLDNPEFRRTTGTIFWDRDF
jgi:hypothetical protein